jgi:cytochrome c biogenesis protein CcdA
MEDRRRMWILGSAFIVTSAFVYFIFMVGWLNLIMFLGVNTWIKIAIGLVALIAGGYSLKEYMTNKKGGCKVEKSEKQKAVFNKLKNVTKKENFWVALFGIILLAFAVNLVELMCSAGFPAMYTQVLALSNLQSWQYYMYIGFYVFFFMLDDMIVFFTSMVALELTGITTKFDRASKLIGGILMVIIGLLLIFKPELLMFG